MKTHIEGKTRKILILGSSGQVGAYLTEYLRMKDMKSFEFDITNGSDQDMTVIPNGELEGSKFIWQILFTSLHLM